MLYPEVIGVVLNWNGWRLTIECLEALTRQEFPVTILLIDNGSVDGSLTEIAARTQAKYETIALSENLGFAGGMNVGIQLALDRGADYVWLINNDAIARPDCLAELVQCMERDRSISIATPRLVGADGVEQHCGGVFQWRTGVFEFRKSDELVASSEKDVWISGTAPIIRSDALRSLGSFDQRFFAYWEDVDLSLRATDTGGCLRAVPTALVFHDAGSSTGGVSSPIAQFLDSRNEWLVIRKRISGMRRVAAFAAYCARRLRRAGHLQLLGHHNAAIAVVEGMCAAAIGQFGKPWNVDAPGLVVRVLTSHPWKLAAAMDWVSSCLPRISVSKTG